MNIDDVKKNKAATKNKDLIKEMAENHVELGLKRLEYKKAGSRNRISQLEETVLNLRKENEALVRLSEPTPQIFHVKPTAGRGKSESAACVMLSDWHNEEEVKPGAVGGKNKFNLEICEERVNRMLQGALSWFDINRRATTIKTLVLGLLGDFISGSIHEDLAESNLLPPVEAIYRAQNLLIGAIRFFLKNTPQDVEILLVCHSGNHGRMTKRQRIATETGNSLEQYMYYVLRDFFQGEKRLRFQIATGYHSFVNFFEDSYRTRWHHGHMINYQGGVGGITIPVNKAIAQWNKANPVDLDAFGHFHQKLDGGNFVCNGSLIGFNSYAVSIKASFEEPAQQFFLINREFRAKTVIAPIFVK